MIKKTIVANHTELAFLETPAQANQVVFFIHGNSSSADAMQKQLDAEILSKYKLMAIDLPGHGDSKAAVDPLENYSLQAMGKTMAESVNNLAGDKPFVIVGLSLGSNILAEMLPYCKPAGLVIISTSIIGTEHTMEKAFQKSLDASVFFTDGAPEENIRKFSEDSCFFNSEDQDNLIVADYKKVTKGFRPALFQSAMDGKISDEIAILQDAEIPVLVIFGQNDRFSNPNYLDDRPFKVWKDQIYKLPEARHFAQLDQPEEINKLIAEYCEEAFAG